MLAGIWERENITQQSFVNGLDLLVGCFLAFFCYRGFRKGLVREGCGLAGVILGVTVAIRFRSQFSQLLKGLLSWPGFILEVLSFVLLFMGCVVLLSVAGLVLRRLMRVFLLSFWDGLGGVLLGLFKGAAITGFLILVAQKYLPEDQFKKQTSGSVFARPLTQAASFVLRTIERREKSTASYDGLKQEA